MVAVIPLKKRSLRIGHIILPCCTHDYTLNLAQASTGLVNHPQLAQREPKSYKRGNG